MENMEQDLQNKKTMTQQVNAGRTTRGVNNSSKYMEQKEFIIKILKKYLKYIFI